MEAVRMHRLETDTKWPFSSQRPRTLSCLNSCSLVFSFWPFFYCNKRLESTLFVHRLLGMGCSVDTCEHWPGCFHWIQCVQSLFFFINHVATNVALNSLSSSTMSDLQKAILDKQVGITCCKRQYPWFLTWNHRSRSPECSTPSYPIWSLPL